MVIHDNDRHAVVLDIGHKYTKYRYLHFVFCIKYLFMLNWFIYRCGFVGESDPRVIIPSKVLNDKKLQYLHQYSNEKELHSNLVKFLHTIFFKYIAAQTYLHLHKGSLS